MRTFCTLLALSVLSTAHVAAQSALENVILEKYYISDANDAADTDGGTLLAEGSVTYRIFLDMGADCKLRGLFADSLHPFIISSTTVLFNNNDRGDKYGHEIDDARLDENTVALDSWLSLGDASDAHTGVLKVDDADGSIVGGANNDGGSEGVPGGLLANAHPDAGTAITTADGLVPSSGQAPPGFLFLGDVLEPLYDENSDSSYMAQNMVMQSPAGIAGYGVDNKILIAQITTTGELGFHLNVEIIDANGVAQKFVANGDSLQAGETEFGLLNYPPECGCTDPDFLEYDPAAGCDDGSCQTEIVFGCLDPLACNFDPGANFNVLALCCYGPGNCNGLDITIVCPDVAVDENAQDRIFAAFPNPVHELLTVHLPAHAQGSAVIVLFDRLGRAVQETALGGAAASQDVRLDMSGFARGFYTVRLVMDGQVFVQSLVKQ
ncbi:MAG: T9SS type A sorting domain-containing protein [Flavobacteriales bacterium]